jgi:hypothetical protein
MTDEIIKVEGEIIESEDNVSNSTTVDLTVNTNVKGFIKGYDPRRNYKGGKPKGTSLAENSRLVLSEAVKDQNITKEIGILRKLADDALLGSTQSAELLFRKAYGKDIEQIQLSRFEDENEIYDMSKLSPEEVEIWSRLEAKARKTESEEG